MKFTEGYWVVSEQVKASYASQAFYAEKIDGGMRIVMTERPIKDRGDALNISTITLDFIVFAENNIQVTARHYEAYDNKEARFELYKEDTSYTVEITDEKAVMDTGVIAVHVNRRTGQYYFVSGDKVVTSCGFRNLGYMRWDKQPNTMLAKKNYMSDLYTPYMLTELSLKPEERVYGLGERFSAFVKNGQSIECWNEDGGTSSQIAYKNVPFYVTSEGYGIFVDHAQPVSFEVASEKVEYVGFTVEGEVLRYHFIYGPEIKEVLRTYTDMTGKPALPPAWSFGLWLTTSFTTSYDENTTSLFIDGMLERNLPLRVFHFDCYWMRGLKWCDFEWDNNMFHNVPEMLKRYKEERGLKICVWINPYFAQGTELFKYGVAHDYFLKRKDGKGVKQTDFWQPGMAILDVTNPDALKWYTQKLRELLAIGVDCFKTDFGERIPIDVTYYDGSEPVSMHNYYTYLYNKAVFELLKEVKGEQEAVVFARSATAGSQKFPVHWGGDSSASYPSMAETLRGGLSFALSGFSFWSHDISGFEQIASPDVYKRWVQFGMLSTHSRLHGSTSYRVPWLFDDEACDVVRYFTNLKCKLMPYLYRMSVYAHETGIPVMRPMILEYMGEMGMKDLDMQYMLGESLLVAPVFREDGTVEYYLPEGRWTHLLTEETKEGGRWYQDTYDYFSLPLFVRENTLLAIGYCDDKPDYDYSNQVAFHLYSLKNGQEAKAEVPDLEGKNVLCAVAKREGNQITLSINSIDEQPIFILHGIYQVQAEQGCKVEERKEGICIIPLTSQVKVTI